MWKMSIMNSKNRQKNSWKSKWPKSVIFFADERRKDSQLAQKLGRFEEGGRDRRMVIGGETLAGMDDELARRRVCRVSLK